MILLNQELYFPDVHYATPEGLLAVGGDLSVERLLLAYRSGIFPWFNDDEPILWWSPDPRCVLFPEQLKVTRSMQQLIRQQRFRFSFNNEFEEVISSCKYVSRPGGEGTWITNEMMQAYIQLHQLGFAVSGACYLDDKLVGGLYGVLIEDCFFGESMFSTMSNASKFAFIHLIRHLQEVRSVKIVDCQQATHHLLSLGAELIPRKDFLNHIAHIR